MMRGRAEAQDNKKSIVSHTKAQAFEPNAKHHLAFKRR